jgi:hypothetical protein
MVPDSAVIIKNWFFPKEYSVLEIYQQIASNKAAFTKENITTFDLEIRANEHDSEQLVVGYFLTQTEHQKLLSPYELMEWPIVAIEPESLLNQRLITKAWQFEAQAKFAREYPQLLKQQHYFEKTLKLLDRDNYTL